jgi:arylsulfatase A-like enzyme
MKALLFIMLLAAGTAAVIGRPPNIILFVADDLGFETLRCYGGTSHPTPHLDRLAADGMRFDSCVATAMCATSRAMLLSGRYNSRNYDTWAHLDPAEATLATRLREAGYVTGMAGKWHLGNWEPDATGSDGTSFLPWLRDTPHPEPRRVAFTWGTLDGSNRVYHDPVRHRAAILHAARDERWRYFSDGRLFDIVADPLMRASVPPGATPEADLARSRSTASIHW